MSSSSVVQILLAQKFQKSTLIHHPLFICIWWVYTYCNESLQINGFYLISPSSVHIMEPGGDPDRL